MNWIGFVGKLIYFQRAQLGLKVGHGFALIVAVADKHCILCLVDDATKPLNTARHLKVMVPLMFTELQFNM